MYDARERKTRTAMGCAIRKYGEDCWVKEELHTTDSWKEACQLEMQEIANHNTFGRAGYNLTRGGDGATGAIRSREAIEKVAAAHRGRKRSAETCRRISEAARGRVATEKVRQARLASGKRLAAIPITIEQRRKISVRLKGHSVSQETRRKIGAANTGKRHAQHIIDKVTAKITGENSKIAKTVIVRFPDGHEETIKGIANFCRQHNLHSSAVRKAIAAPGKSHHRGYFFRNIDEDWLQDPSCHSSHFTNEIKEQIARRIENGDSVPEVSASLCISEYRIRSLLRR